jgi:hypothetical protein
MPNLNHALAGLRAADRRDALKDLASEILALDRSKMPKRAPRNPAKNAAIVAGCRQVYVIGTPGHPVKIGVAGDPKKRLAGLQTGCAFKLRLLYARVCPLGYELKVETACHKALRSYRVAGEWFDVSREQAVNVVREQLHRYQAIAMEADPETPMLLTSASASPHKPAAQAPPADQPSHAPAHPDPDAAAR